jgi:hypothetical protein
VVTIIATLMATSPAFSRKARHHRAKHPAAAARTVKTNDGGGIQRHPDDIALDRRIGSICRGC